jgi:hypothetical protein
MAGDWRDLPDVAKAPVHPDDWRTLPDVQPQASTHGGSAMGAAGLGFGQGASMGFVDELAGVVGGGTAALSKQLVGGLKTAPGRALARALLGAKGIPDDALDALIDQSFAQSLNEVTGINASDPRSAYEQTRDIARRDSAAAKAAHPTAFTTGEVAGAIASPGPKTKPGAQGLARASSLAKQGALYGGASAAGMSEASPVDNPGRLALDAAMGAGMGAVIAPAVPIVADKFGRGMKTLSQEQALKAMGVRAGISSQLEKRGYETADAARQLGQDALDMELVRPFRTAEDVAERAGFAKETQGARIEGALSDADAAVPFDAERASWDMAGNVMGPEGLSPAAIDKSRGAQRLVRNAADLPRVQASTFKNANRLKSDMYEGIDYGNDPALKTKLERKAAGGLRKSIEDQVAEAAGPDAADELRAANRAYGSLSDIQPLAREEANRQLERASILDPKTLAASFALGGAGAASGNASMGAAGGLLPLIGKALSPRAPSTIAIGARAASRYAPKVLPPLARPATQQLAQEEEDAISEFLSGGG